MELILQLLMLLVLVASCLKLSYTPRWFVVLYALSLGLFIYWTADFASEQTRAEVERYIKQQSLREYISIFVTIEAMLFVVFAVGGFSSLSIVKRNVLSIQQILRFCPPLLMYPTMLYWHILLLFNWTGVDFALLRLLLSVGGGLLIVLIPLCIHKLLPEIEMRLELLCLGASLIFLLGLITTIDYDLVYEAPKSELPLRLWGIHALVVCLLFTLGYFVPNLKRLIQKYK